MAFTTTETVYLAGEALPSAIPAPLISPELVAIARRIPGALLLAALATLVYGESGRLLKPR
jgi:hypothetical protein